jgi:uncharacterized protein
MTEVKCQSPACDQIATIHFIRADGRPEVEVSHFCDLHGRSHIDKEQERYYSPSRVGAGKPITVASGAAFGIDFLLKDELQEQPFGYCRVGLIEVGGNRRIDFQIGPCECGALDFELQRYQSPRPLTYRALAAVITTLGGRLHYVEIDRFSPAQSIYEAKLHIQQLNAALEVDVRPSDALILAVICDVPIVVSNSVLAAMGEITGQL